MTLTLWYEGEIIINYEPGKQWWITGFNPDYKNVKASELTASFTVYLRNNKELYYEFYESGAREKGWIFDEATFTASLTF